MLHGVCSPFMLTIPTIGLAIAASSSPIARIKARCGVRVSPSLVMSERNLLTFLSFPLLRTCRFRAILGATPDAEPEKNRGTHDERRRRQPDFDPDPAIDAPHDRRRDD